MTTINKNNNGFTLIAALLCILILTVVGFGSYYIWHIQHTQKNTTTRSSTPAALKPDPTANWTAYTDATGKFSLRYPTTWVMASHPELCSPGLLLLGPTANSVGVCGSANFGEISVQSTDGDHRSSYYLTGNAYASVHKKVAVTVNGMNGTRQDSVAHGLQTAVDNGTSAISYVFYANGKTYVAEYQKATGYPDVSSDFDLMVTNTLKFE